jgi:hypothetical protein
LVNSTARAAAIKERELAEGVEVRETERVAVPTLRFCDVANAA